MCLVDYVRLPFVEGGGVWPVGGVWSTRSAGAIGSGCRQVSAIRPNQEVCIYVPALPFSRERESGRRSRGQSDEGEKTPRKRHSNCGPSGARDVQPMLYLLFAFSNKANRVFK